MIKNILNLHALYTLHKRSLHKGMNNGIYEFLKWNTVDAKTKIESQKEIGLVLLGFVALYWISFPIIPFLDIPYKAAVITGLMIVGEILFLIAIALLGKEYWGKIKEWFSKIFRKMKLKEN